MKHTIKTITSILLAGVMLASIAGCGDKIDPKMADGVGTWDQNLKDREKADADVTNTDADVKNGNVSSVSTSTSEDDPAAEVKEPEVKVYTLKDCFDEGATIITDASAFADYINNLAYTFIHIYSGETSYASTDTNGSATTNELMSEDIYVAKELNEEKGIKSKVAISKIGEAGANDQIEATAHSFDEVFGVELDENASASDVLLTLMNIIKADSLYSDIYVPIDYVIDEEMYKHAKEKNEITIYSALDKNLIFTTVLPGETYSSLVSSYFSYTLKDIGNGLVVPVNFAVFIQYDNTDYQNNVRSMLISVEEISEERAKTWLQYDLKGTKFTFEDIDAVKYAKDTVNVRDLPSLDGEKLGSFKQNDEVKVTGRCVETGWWRFEYKGKTGYCNGNYLVDEKVEQQAIASTDTKSKFVHYKDYTQFGIDPNFNPYEDPSYVWEGGVDGEPYSVDGYVINQFWAEGDNMYIYFYYGPGDLWDLHKDGEAIADRRLIERTDALRRWWVYDLGYKDPVDRDWEIDDNIHIQFGSDGYEIIEKWPTGKTKIIKSRFTYNEALKVRKTDGQ